MADNIDIARAAILDDLKRRFKSGDTTVRPANPEDLHRWYKPQANYFSGHGEILPCPVCGRGVLVYERSPYNGHVSAYCSNEQCVRWKE